MNWRHIDTAPKDGTWILGVNNRGNMAVIIWSELALDHFGRRQPGWIHPFSDGRVSSFWNGGCGSVATHWMPLPPRPEQESAPVGVPGCEWQNTHCSGDLVAVDWDGVKGAPFVVCRAHAKEYWPHAEPPSPGPKK